MLEVSLSKLTFKQPLIHRRDDELIWLDEQTFEGTRSHVNLSIRHCTRLLCVAGAPDGNWGKNITDSDASLRNLLKSGHSTSIRAPPRKLAWSHLSRPALAMAVITKHTSHVLPTAGLRKCSRPLARAPPDYTSSTSTLFITEAPVAVLL